MLAVFALPALVGCGDDPGANVADAGAAPAADGGPATLADAGADVAVDAAADAQQVFPPETVHGRVVSAVNSGVAATVLIAGHPPISTDGNGGFRVDGVASAYDLTVVRTSSDGSHRIATTFARLTKRDPTVAVGLPVGGTLMLATVDETLSGPAFVSPQPVDVGTSLKLFLDANDGAANALAGLGAGSTGSGSIDATWYDGASTNGSLFALQARYVNYLPTSFLGFGKADNIALRGGQQHTLVNVPMTSVGTGSLSGTIDWAPGATSGECSAWISVDGHEMLLSSNVQCGTTFNFLVPLAPNASFFVRAVETFPDGGQAVAYSANLSGSATNVTVKMSYEPSAMQPTDHAVGVGASTSFQWLPPVAQVPTVHMLVVQPQFSEITHQIFTTELSAQLPDLSPLGIQLAKSTDHWWWVVSRTSLPASIDAIAAPNGLPRRLPYGASPMLKFTSAL